MADSPQEAVGAKISTELGFYNAVRNGGFFELREEGRGSVYYKESTVTQCRLD